MAALQQQQHLLMQRLPRCLLAAHQLPPRGGYPCSTSVTQLPRRYRSANSAENEPAGLSSSPPPQAAAAAAAGQPQAAPVVRQVDRSWRLQTSADLTVAIVDGHNLALRCSSSSRGKSSSLSSLLQPGFDAQFAGWLRFLKAYCQAAVLLVAFDNKGSSSSNYRASLDPRYLHKRYQRPAPPTPGELAILTADLKGTQPGQQGEQQQQPSQQSRHLGSAPQKLQQQQQQRFQTPSHWVELVLQAGGVPCHAAPGYEADDMIAALAAWCSSQGPPSPAIVVVSADADLWQLTKLPGLHWLQLAQVPSKACPSGLALHDGPGFQWEHGYPAAAHEAYLALAGGKGETGMSGLGLSRPLVKRLVARYCSLDAILAAAAAGQLKAGGDNPMHKLLGPGADPEAAAAAVTKARRNLQVLSLQPGAQQIPEYAQRAYQRAAEAAAAAEAEAGVARAAAAPGVGQSGGTGGVLAGCSKEQQQGIAATAAEADSSQQSGQQQQQQQQQSGQQPQGSQVLSAQELAAMHPAKQHHLQEAAPYLQRLAASLRMLGLTDHQVGWLSPEGHLLTLVVRIYGEQGQPLWSETSGPHQSGGAGSSSTPAHPISSSSSSGSGRACCYSKSNSLVLQVLGPSDFKPISQGKAPAAAAAAEGPTHSLPATGSSRKGSVRQRPPAGGFAAAKRHQAEQELQGHLLQLNPEPCRGLPLKKLMQQLRDGPRLQHSLARSSGWTVAVVPFYELAATNGYKEEQQMAAGRGTGGDSSSRSSGGVEQSWDCCDEDVRYVLDLLKQQASS